MPDFTQDRINNLQSHQRKNKLIQTFLNLNRLLNLKEDKKTYQFKLGKDKKYFSLYSISRQRYLNVYHNQQKVNLLLFGLDKVYNPIMK